jgi:hypothetical protein
MNTYLLLRNNKETGPHTMEELVKMGLKAYDLVWSNGRSAAWRYPGEIEELKPYAPVVEEQPFDRFYKKETSVSTNPVAEIKQSTPAAVSQTPLPVTTEQVPEVEKPVTIPVQQSQPAFVPGKSVFVAMPVQPPVKQEPVVAATTASTDNYSQYQQYQPSQKIITTPKENIVIQENPVTAEIKYQQPLDEIKEMYVKTLQQRKHRIAKKALVFNVLKKAAVVALIIGTGVIIGFSMKSKNVAKPSATIDTPVTQKDPVVQTPALTQPVEEQGSPTILPSDDASDNSTDNSISSSQQNAAKELANTQVSKTPIREVQQEAVKQPQRQPANMVRDRSTDIVEEPVKQLPPAPRQQSPTYRQPDQGLQIDNRTGERSRKTRDESTPVQMQSQEREEEEVPVREERNVRPSGPKAMMKQVITKNVSVESNDYVKVAFGGIRNLQLTVYNDSKYVLENVLVELQYLRAGGQPYRTENIQFRGIPSGSSQTIRMPDTNRGIAVTYRIVNILSNQPGREQLANN